MYEEYLTFNKDLSHKILIRKFVRVHAYNQEWKLIEVKQNSYRAEVTQTKLFHWKPISSTTYLEQEVFFAN